jgi:hypothetical protein
MTDSRATIFSMMFGIFYLAAFYYDLALFRYYPEVRQFHFLRNDSLGVVILWYGWIATAALASAAIAFAVPRRIADRLWSGWAWIVPTAVVVVMLIYERRWFVS